MALTDSLVTVVDALKSHVESGSVALGIKDVWYGEEELIPRTPALSIIPGNKTRVLSGTGQMTDITFRAMLVIFHSRLADPGVTRRECDLLSEQVESLLHDNTRLGGIVIHSHVESIEPGVATRDRVIMRATRLMWVATSKTRL